MLPKIWDNEHMEDFHSIACQSGWTVYSIAQNFDGETFKQMDRSKAFHWGKFDRLLLCNKDGTSVYGAFNDFVDLIYKDV